MVELVILPEAKQGEGEICGLVFGRETECQAVAFFSSSYISDISFLFL